MYSGVGLVPNGIMEGGSSDYNTIVSNDLSICGGTKIQKLGANTLDHPNTGYSPTASYLRVAYLTLYDATKIEFTETDITTRNQWYDPPWIKINTADYPSTMQCYLEITGYKTEAGTISSDLYCYTDSAIVTDSDVTLTNTAPKQTARSDAFSLVSGHKDYYVRLAVNNGTGNIFKVALRLEWYEITPN